MTFRSVCDGQSYASRDIFVTQLCSVTCHCMGQTCLCDVALAVPKVLLGPFMSLEIDFF